MKCIGSCNSQQILNLSSGYNYCLSTFCSSLAMSRSILSCRKKLNLTILPPPFLILPQFYLISTRNGKNFFPKTWNNKKRSHTQLDSRKQVIAFQDRVITINIKEAQHPLKWEKQVIDKSSIMLKISTKSMHRVLVWEIGPANNTTRCSRLSKRRLLHAWHPSQLAINLSIDKSKWQIHVNNKSD